MSTKLLKSSFIMFLLCAFPYLSADTIDLTSVSGVWNNATSNGSPPTNFSGGGTNEIHWGNPAGGSGNSGYVFTGDAPQNNLALDTPFDLGTFTHLNFPITGNALTSVDLNVSAMLDINGTVVSFSGTYHFLHDETPNIPTPQDPNCCNDLVTFVNNVAQSTVFNIGGVDYTIGLIGFKTTPNGSLLQQFSTVENQSNTATLFAQISRPDVFVPEPSTYMIMASFLLVCCWVATRKKVRVY